MVEFSSNCPRCGTKNVAIELTNVIAAPRDRIAVLARCKNCAEALLVEMEGTSTPFAGNILEDEITSRVIRIFPEAAVTTISSLHASVDTAFNEAEDVWQARNLNAAAMMYRRAIERALKHLHPELKGSLAARIRKLEESAEIPKALVQLLDRVRYLGNDAAHEDEDVTELDVAAGREFTIAFLRYTYEIPAQIEMAIARREDRNS